MQIETTAQPGVATPSRRRIVTVGALGTAGICALAACGGGDDSAATPAASSGSAAAAGGTIAKLADVPVGGAISAESGGTKLIVAQPTAGTVVAFDARCPHQGCTVAPGGENLACPCHGSTFQTDSGEVIKGPATSGLTPVTVKVDGENIVAG